MVLDPEQTKLWEEARGYAVAEILAKYRKELAEAHSRQFSRRTKRAADLAIPCANCSQPAMNHPNRMCDEFTPPNR